MKTDKINIKDNIWMLGRTTSLNLTRITQIHLIFGDEVIYSGKTSDMPVEFAKFACDEKYCLIYKKI